MFPTEIHQDMTATLGKPAVSCNIVKRCCRKIKYDTILCEDEHGSTQWSICYKLRRGRGRETSGCLYVFINHPFLVEMQGLFPWLG